MLFIFDMGGVVTNTAGNDILEVAAKKMGISREKLLELAGKNTGGERDLFYKLDVGKLTAKEFWKILGERAGVEVKSDWFRLLFHPVLNSETAALVEELKKAGHRVVCGTNTIDSHYDNHLSRGDYAFFDMTYASIHMGVRKPELDFWRLIMEAEGFKAEQTFFTDDRRENVEAAASLGINSYLFDNAEGFRKFINEKLSEM